MDEAESQSSFSLITVAALNFFDEKHTEESNKN